MIFASTKELRLHTKGILERVKRGERFAITYRGKPVALLVPVDSGEFEGSLRPYEEAWADIVRALEETEPRWLDWDEALRESRRRG